jgi:hypothetical protein
MEICRLAVFAAVLIALVTALGAFYNTLHCPQVHHITSQCLPSESHSGWAPSCCVEFPACARQAGLRGVLMGRVLIRSQSYILVYCTAQELS